MFKPDPMLEYAAPGEPSLIVKVTWSVARICGGIAGMILCGVLGAVLPELWEGVSGRDYRPAMTNVAILIFALSTACRGVGRFRLLEMLASLIGIEILILGIIAQVTESSFDNLFDWFNMSWLRGISLYVAPPWLLGMIVGSGVLFLRGPAGRRGFEKLE